LKCIYCKTDYPFDVTHNIKKDVFGFDNYSYIYAGSRFCNIDNQNLLTNRCSFPNADEGVIEYTFVCNMVKVHYYKMYLFYKLTNGELELIKIGQFPITRDLKNTYSNEYKDILVKYNSFDDYRMYEQSYERGLLAGACTYLRRVFEKMVFTLLQDPSIDEGSRNNATHFDEKIKLVKNLFDEDIREVLEESYDLLSKGVHELTNDEIDEFCSLLEEVVNVQLESEREKQERTNRLFQLRKSIHKQHNKNSAK